MGKIVLGDTPIGVATGYRDAVHVAVVISQFAGPDKLNSGDKVVFEDNSLQSVIKAKEGQTSHGILDPFGPTISQYDEGIILINPSSTRTFSHTFSLDVEGLYDRYEDDYGCGRRGC